MKISAARDELLAILNNKALCLGDDRSCQATDPSVIKQLLVIDYTLETQQKLEDATF